MLPSVASATALTISTRSVDPTATPATGPTPTEAALLPEARVVRAGRVVILGTGAAGRLEHLAALADQGATAARRATWPAALGELVVLAPGRAADYARLAGASSVEGMPATHPPPAVTTGAVSADGRMPEPRILLDPVATGGLTDRALRFLLTHEAVHCLTGEQLGGQRAWWVDEGVADLVAARAVDLSDAEQAGDLARAGAFGPFPSARDGAGAGDPAVPYAAARLTVTVLAEARPDADLGRFLAAATVPPGRPAGEVQAAALRAAETVFGLSARELERRWREVQQATVR